MNKTHRTLIDLATLCALMVGASGAVAQDQEVYDAIDCSQWVLNPDGTWKTGPRAAIPGTSRRLSNQTHLDMAGFYVNGVDISTWLNAKCVNKCQKQYFGFFEVCN